MERIGMPLLVHGEVTDRDVDIFDREAVFIERHLQPLLQRHQGLKVVLEHITTDEAVAFVKGAGPRVAATITPHHLHINRNAMFQGGLRADFYCLPVAKAGTAPPGPAAGGHQRDSSFFLGTDSAPHLRAAKESACGCAGIFNAPYAIESYATVFEQEGVLERLEAFASEAGPRFYGLPPNGDHHHPGARAAHRASPAPPQRCRRPRPWNWCRSMVASCCSGSWRIRRWLPPARGRACPDAPGDGGRHSRRCAGRR
jgi:dihydroorotase